MSYYSRVALLGTFLFSILTAPSVTAGTIYKVKFKITNTSTYEAVDFDVNYSAANGSFVGSGDTVDCTTNSSLNAIAVYNDDDPDLKAALMRLTTFSTPHVLIVCNFDANGAKPAKSDFVITVDGWGPTASPSPTIVVSRIW